MCAFHGGKIKFKVLDTGRVSVSPAGDRLAAAAGLEPCKEGGVGFRPQHWPRSSAWEAFRGPAPVEDSPRPANLGLGAWEEHGCQN